jgi:hypothetical protein
MKNLFIRYMKSNYQSDDMGAGKTKRAKARFKKMAKKRAYNHMNTDLDND